MIQKLTSAQVSVPALICAFSFGMLPSCVYASARASYALDADLTDLSAALFAVRGAASSCQMLDMQYII
jgi:hypothetical protein